MKKTVTIYKKEWSNIKQRVINNAKVEYFDQYIKVTEENGKEQAVKNFNNMIVE